MAQEGHLPADLAQVVDDSFIPWEHLDWSFGVILVAVVVLCTVLIRRYRRTQRRQRRADKRARHRAYRDWLQAGGMVTSKRGKLR